jgi:4-amino-4-deoxy-L-arabinose transferase-like glycosyltransferase
MMLTWGLRLVALGLGAAHVGVAILRQSMNEDGINYLDAGTAFVQGDWATAVSPIWSPLYAWMLGVVLWVTQPSIPWEFPVVQMANFVIFALALACFEFFWRELARNRRQRLESSAELLALPAPAWTVLGYSLFIWSSLGLVEIWAVTPDMSVAALVYLAAGLVLRTTRSDGTAASLVLLGVVLGLGYLAKAVLLPLGIACIVLAGMVRAERGRAMRIGLAMASFLVVAAPLIAALSIASGRVTFGDVGRFTYLKHVNGLRYPHWDETIDRVDGAPAHPPRRVFENPDVYEFASPIGGSYPLAFNPSYWTAGLSPRLDLERQLRASLSNGRFYFELFLRTQGAFVAIAALLGVMALAAGIRPVSVSAEAALVLWAVCAFGIYTMVFVAPRYVAPFVVIFWAGLLAPLRLPASPTSRRLVGAAGVLLAAVVWVNIAALNAEGLGAALNYAIALPTDASAVEDPRPRAGARGSAQEIAAGLLGMGVREGDRVGLVGYSFTAYWARLARLRIVAEIAPAHADAFWAAAAGTQAEILRRFADAGASVVVAEPPRTVPPPGWVEVGSTGYLLRRLGTPAVR